MSIPEHTNPLRATLLYVKNAPAEGKSANLHPSAGTCDLRQELSEDEIIQAAKSILENLGTLSFAIQSKPPNSFCITFNDQNVSCLPERPSKHQRHYEIYTDDPEATFEFFETRIYQITRRALDYSEVLDQTEIGSSIRSYQFER